MSSHDPLVQLRRLDVSSPEFNDQVCHIIDAEEYKQGVQKLEGDDLVWFVDYLNEALDGFDSSSFAFRKCQRELRKICGARVILPTSYTLPPHLLSIGPDPLASGGYGDVYGGTLDGSRVCIKRVRVYAQDGPQQAVKTFCREAIIWKRLSHPNIVPLLGVTLNPFQLVSNWMSGGNLPEYIKKHLDADRLGLLSDVAKGLYYLHSCDVIHGDLRGTNILVDEFDHARIADFGFATVTQNLDSIRSVFQHDHAARWTAPEVLNGGPYSKEADVFSFSMVMVEVFTDAVPFGSGSSVMAMLAIMQGRRPQRPTHPTCTEELWKLIQRCWDHDPHLRPEISEALRVLLTPENPPWKRLISSTLAENERISLITEIFSDRNQVKIVGHLSGDDGQKFIDTINEVLDSLTPRTRRRCLRYLYSICGHQILIPRSLEIPLCYDPTEDPMCRGGFADVWKGQYRGEGVAAKVLRLYPKDDLGKMRSRFCREAVAWRALRHPNVLPLLGVTMTDNQLVMVSQWMVNGNINEFVKTHINANRLELLGDVVRGLMYVHNQGMVHGDLTGDNILVDDNSRARLAGFSLLTMTSDRQVIAPSTNLDGTIRWMSPELLIPEAFGLKDSRPTKQSDCYALGMVVYEVLCGQAPFAPRNETAVIFKVLEGERPERPRGAQGTWFTDEIWGMLELCWKSQPGDRPSLEAVLRCLQGVMQPSKSPGTDGSIETDVDDQSDATSSDSGQSVTRGGNGLPVTLQSLSRRARRTNSSLATTHVESELVAPSPNRPPGATSPMTSPGGGKLSAPPKRGSSRGGWVGRLVHGTRRMFKTIIKKFSGH